MATRTVAPKTRATTKVVARPTAKPAAKPAAKTASRPPAQKPAAPVKPPKLKAKLVRDSFTMPQADFALIAALKERALGFRRPTKKSELLRAGLQVLAGLNDAALQSVLEALPALKLGRPKKAD